VARSIHVGAPSGVEVRMVIEVLLERSKGFLVIDRARPQNSSPPRNPEAHRYF